MSNKVLYDNVDVFASNSIPTPSFSLSMDKVMLGDVISNEESIILRGQIPECGNLENLAKKRDQILLAFSKNYKQLRLLEGSKIIFDKNLVEISHVKFDTSSYIGVLNFEILIKSYDELNFKQFYGIKNPGNTISVNKDDNGNIIINQSISAEGVNTKSYSGKIFKNETKNTNSLQNAIDFVSSIELKDLFLQDDIKDINFHLINRIENIDRFSGVVEVSRTFKGNKNSTNVQDPIENIKIEVRKDATSIQTASVSGSIQMGMDFTISDVVENFKKINFHQKLVDLSGESNYNEHPKDIKLNIAEEINAVNFEMTFEKNSMIDQCGVSHIINSSVAENESGIITSTISGSILSYGRNENKWRKIKKEFHEKSYDVLNYSSWMHEQAQKAVDNIYSGINIRGEVIAQQIEESQNNGTISYNFSFSNKETVENFKDFSLSFEVIDDVDRYSVDLNYGGGMNKLIVTKHGKNIPSISISSNGIYKENSLTKDQALQALKDKIEERFISIENEMFSSYYSNIESETNSYNENTNYCSYEMTKNYYLSKV